MRLARFFLIVPFLVMGCAYTPEPDSAAAVAPAEPAASAAPAPATRPAAAPVLLPSQQISWTPMKFPSGAQISVLSGDPQTGPFRALQRWPAGTRVPLHIHTHDSRAFAHSGTMVLRFEGQSPVELGPGSWATIPGGAPHETICRSGGGDCVFYIEMSGPADTIIKERR